MPRKKKIKGNNDVYPIKLERVIANTPTTRNNLSGGYVNYGQRNNFPDQLLNLLAQSPTLSSCVNFCVTALVGGGVDYEAMGYDGSQLMPNYRMTWDSFIRRISFDYFVFGSFAVQVIKNRDGRTYSFYPQNFNTVRAGIPDDDGVVNSYYLCRDWSATSRNPVIEIPSLVARGDEQWNIKSGEPYLFVPEFFSPYSDVYPTPCYTSALKAVQAEAEFLNYDLKTAANLFAPAGAISLPPAESEEQKQAILNNIQSMFAGTENAQQLLVTFRNDSEDSPITFTPFTASTDNVDLFSSSNDRNIDRILSCFSIPSRNLIGLPLGNVGFSSESEILRTAYELYETLFGNASRRDVVGVLNTMFHANGIDTEVVLKPLNFGQSNAAETAEVEEETISENNIEEQQQ